MLLWREGARQTRHEPASGGISHFGSEIAFGVEEAGLPNLTAEAQTFVLQTLKPCPSQRWSAHTALNHKFLLATGSDDVGEGDKGERVG